MRYAFPQENLENAMRQSTSLKSLMARYAHALGIQTTYTALANAENKLEQRLARWILMVDDRIDGHHFRATHAFIAMTLGVRRAGVTVALKLLEVRLLIKDPRREIFVLDRQGLIDLTNAHTALLRSNTIASFRVLSLVGSQAACR